MGCFAYVTSGWLETASAIDYNCGKLNIYSDTRYDVAEDGIVGVAPMMTKSIDIEPDDIDVSDTATFAWGIE